MTAVEFINILGGCNFRRHFVCLSLVRRPRENCAHVSQEIAQYRDFKIQRRGRQRERRLKSEFAFF